MGHSHLSIHPLTGSHEWNGIIDAFLALTPSNAKKVSDFWFSLLSLFDGKHQFMPESHSWLFCYGSSHWKRAEKWSVNGSNHERSCSTNVSLLEIFFISFHSSITRMMLVLYKSPTVWQCEANDDCHTLLVIKSSAKFHGHWLRDYSFQGPMGK